MITRRRYHIKSVALAKSGRSKIEWAEGQMPVLLKIRSRVARTKPLKGVRLACCLHVTTETAHLMLTLKAAGAQVVLCASNPLSTQDDVAASLVKDYGVSVYAVRGEKRNSCHGLLLRSRRMPRSLLLCDSSTFAIAVLAIRRTIIRSGRSRSPQVSVATL